jgi:hypothetical protein
VENELDIVYCMYDFKYDVKIVWNIFFSNFWKTYNSYIVYPMCNFKCKKKDHAILHVTMAKEEKAEAT